MRRLETGVEGVALSFKLRGSGGGAGEAHVHAILPLAQKLIWFVNYVQRNWVSRIQH